MSAVYRSGQARCPTCAVMMETRDIDGAEVDVCGGCGAIWIDPTDGPVDALTRKVVALTGEPAASVGAAEESRPLCPRCGVVLDLDFGMPKQIDVVLERCGSCDGVFLSREHALRVAAFDGPPLDLDAVKQRPRWLELTRLTEVLKKVFQSYGNEA